MNWCYLFDVEEVLLAKQRIIGKAETYYLKINYETGCLEFFTLQKTIAFIVDLLDLQQIRDTEKCRDSMTYLKYAFENQFALLYGKKFILKCLLLKAVDKHTYEVWMSELPKAVDYIKRKSSYTETLNRFLSKQYYLISDNLEYRNLKELYGALKVWFEQNNYRFKTNNELFSLFERYEHLKNLPLTFEKFKEVYDHVVLDKLSSMISSLFCSYFTQSNQNVYHTFNSKSRNIIENQLIIEKGNLIKWLKEGQSLTHNNAERMADLILENYSENKNSYLTQKNFLLYLLSKDNSICDPEKLSCIYHDMNQPLNNYWISCSHNTYLTGNQFTSDSSAECYIRALQLGCRSLEIDVWNSDNSIIITHGFTRCSQIDFKDVLHSINAYAFEYSQFPLLISIENHCSIENQRKMASDFRSIFGDKLITDFLNPNESKLPSPRELAGRIILKNAKNPSRGTPSYETRKEMFQSIIDSESLNEDENAQEMEVWDEIEQCYQKYVFKIENTQLYYWKLLDNDKKEVEEPLYQNVFDSKFSGEVNEYYYNEATSDAEPWLIENLDRDKSEEILTNYKECYQDGTFLIRKSTTGNSEYTFCILNISLSKNREPQIFNARIYKYNQKYYYVNQDKKFQNLTDLVDYYRGMPITVHDEMPIYLGFGVHKRTISVDEDWYFPELKRDPGVELLTQYKCNGSFFIRGAENNSGPNEEKQTHVYTLSFFLNNTTYFSKIFVEYEDFQIKYFINNKEFGSLKDLVTYHEQVPVLDKQKLTKGLKSFFKDTGKIEIPTNSPHNAVRNVSSNSYVESTPRTGSSLIPLESTPSTSSLSSLASSANTTITLVSTLTNSNDTYIEMSSDMRFLEISQLQLICTFNDSTRKYDFTIVSQNNLHEIVIKGMASKNAYNSLLLKVEAIKQTQAVPAATNIPQNSTNKIERLHQDFSNLICYSQAVSFNIENPIGQYYEISSFAEPRKYVQNPQHAKILNKRHCSQLSRVYPKGYRIDSSNYDPVSYWSCSFQLLALNYQTPDRPMQLNHAKFLDNGGCGYVLRPKYMLDENYEPTKLSNECNMYRITVNPTLAHYLPKRNNDAKAASPFIEIELINDYDAPNRNNLSKKFRTNVSKGNGLFPLWNPIRNQMNGRFELANIETAFLRFSVLEFDVIGSDVLVAQATYPVSCLRTGYRSVALKNLYHDDLELSTLLVNISIEMIGKIPRT